MNIEYKRFMVYCGLFLIVSILSYTLLNKYVFNSPVFSLAPNEKQATNWEQIMTIREKRNLVAMNKSYDLLMNMGSFATSSEDWYDAVNNYTKAKTIFPDRIEARKNLCYSYFMLCRRDWRFCSQTKKELYFAMKYVKPSDSRSQNYLLHLVDLAGMSDLVALEESEALSAIYQDSRSIVK